MLTSTEFLTFDWIWELRKVRERQHVLSLERKSKLKYLKSLGNGKEKFGLKVGMENETCLSASTNTSVS